MRDWFVLRRGGLVRAAPTSAVETVKTLHSFPENPEMIHAQRSVEPCQAGTGKRARIDGGTDRPRIPGRQ
ncbi:hypothetical protein D3C85_1074440 [compost metagenome]